MQIYDEIRRYRGGISKLLDADGISEELYYVLREKRELVGDIFISSIIAFTDGLLTADQLMERIEEYRDKLKALYGWGMEQTGRGCEVKAL